MRLSPARLLILAAAVLTAPAWATAQPRTPDQPSISTTGEATVYVVPDKVIISLGVESHDADLDNAKQANERDAARLVKAIGTLGIEAKYIATDNLQVELKYTYDNGWQRLIGYTVRRGYAVTLKDVKLFEKLVDTALKNGANQIHDVSFQTTDLRKYRDQARHMAIRAAKEKAVALAKELDCTVGRPQRISEGGGGYYFYGYRWHGAGNMMSQNSVQEAPPPGAGAGGTDTGDTLPLGQIAVSASVSVTFDLN